MSFTENDRKLRSNRGKVIPSSAGDEGEPFVTVIAAALLAEFGDTPASVKVVARFTRSNERAVRNWFDGKNGPSGGNLMSLMRHSDAVLMAVLNLSHRSELMVATGLPRLRRHLVELLATIDELQAP